MHVLMTLAVCGALAAGRVRDGALVVCLFALARLLEARALLAVQRILRKTVSEMEGANQTAVLAETGEDVPTSALRAGDVVIVRPGERL